MRVGRTSSPQRFCHRYCHVPRMETLLCGYEGYATVRIGHCRFGFRGACRKSSGVFFKICKEVDVSITRSLVPSPFVGSGTETTLLDGTTDPEATGVMLLSVTGGCESKECDYLLFVLRPCTIGRQWAWSNRVDKLSQYYPHK